MNMNPVLNPVDPVFPDDLETVYPGRSDTWYEGYRACLLGWKDHDPFELAQRADRRDWDRGFDRAYHDLLEVQANKSG